MSGGLDQATAAVLAAVEAVEGPLAPKKHAVIEAALICFSQAGYDGTTTRAIAERAGVAEATIFRHFASKADLLVRLARPMAQRLVMPAVAEAEAAWAATGELEAMVRRMMRLRLEFADRYAPLLRILLQELPVNPALRALLAESVAQGLAGFAERMIAAEVASGRMRPIRAGQFLRLLASLLTGYWVTRSLIAPGDWDDEAEIDLMAGVIARGLRH